MLYIRAHSLSRIQSQRGFSPFKHLKGRSSTYLCVTLVFWNRSCAENKCFFLKQKLFVTDAYRLKSHQLMISVFHFTGSLVLMFVCLELVMKVQMLVRALAQICLCHFSGKVWANPLLEVDLCEMHLSSIAIWTKSIISWQKISLCMKISHAPVFTYCSLYLVVPVPSSWRHDLHLETHSRILF